MTKRKRIIVGPTEMYVAYGRYRSEVRQLTEVDGPDDVRRIGRELWETIRPIVSWAVWVLHRSTMAMQRKIAGRVMACRPDMHHPGPRPDHIAERPWKKARYGEWTILPPGVVARIIRANRNIDAIGEGGE